MAQQTVSPASVVVFLCEETPVDGHASRVRDDGLHHRPHHHEEQQMEDQQCGNHVSGPESQHELEHERAVVEDDEHHHTHEVRVYQLSE
jgi:hypothetical protein